MRLSLLPLLVLSTSLQAEPYELGLGYKAHDKLTLGGYFSTEFASGDKTREFALDDVALLAYGNLSDSLSVFAEIEAVGVYTYDFDSHTSQNHSKPAIERLYTDYKFSDSASVRIGKQITPIGYWNLQPINVLRETTSSPRLSREMFPKFVTGLQVHGYAPFDTSVRYSVFLQNTGDMDAKYINIAVDQHYGFSLEKSLGADWSAGLSAGAFRELNDDRTRYLQVNARWDRGQYTLLSEAIVDRHAPRLLADATSSSVYSQFEYRYRPRHALIVRAESFRDDRIALREKIGVLGYSYRPLFPVSLKLEYQWHSDSVNNRLVGSFSVLF